MMSDCSNTEYREALVALMHGRLDAATAAVVERHVADCAACTAERALLARARSALEVRVDVARVAGAVVVETRRAGSRAGSLAADARRAAPWFGAPRGAWRIAAAIAVLATGAGSLLLLRGRSVEPVAATIVAHAAASAPSASDADSATMRATGASASAPNHRTSRTSSAAATRVAELSVGGTSELSDREVEALMRDIESMDAVPSAEPEPVSIHVGASAARGTSE